MLINKGKSTNLKYLNDSDAFIGYSNNMDDIHRNIEECNLNKNLLIKKFYINFYYLVVDLHKNEKI